MNPPGCREIGGYNVNGKAYHIWVSLVHKHDQNGNRRDLYCATSGDDYSYFYEDRAQLAADIQAGSVDWFTVEKVQNRLKAYAEALERKRNEK